MAAPLAALAATAGAKIATGIAGQIAGGRGATSPNEAKARKTAEDFETMFLEQSLERLFTSEGTDGPLGDNGAGGGIYRSMLVKEYAGNLARSGGVGIADQVYREILKLQESNHVRQP
jgi:Rod binding domain-containing protein